jgi:hypothetical protein
MAWITGAAERIARRRRGRAFLMAGMVTTKPRNRQPVTEFIGIGIVCHFDFASSRRT